MGPAKTYQEKLCKRFPMITEVKVAEKADSLYDPVKAASIIAKVVRDFELANWNSVSVGSNREFGSGYPGGILCQSFINNHNNVIIIVVARSKIKKLVIVKLGSSLWISSIN